MYIHYKLRHLVALRGQKFMKKVNLGRKVALRGQKFIKKVNFPADMTASAPTPRERDRECASAGPTFRDPGN